jgi:hypothetical protein
VARDGGLRPSAEGGGSPRWPAGRPRKRASGHLAGPKEMEGSAHMGLRKARGWRASWASGPKPRKREKKIKDFLFLL